MLPSLSCAGGAARHQPDPGRNTAPDENVFQSPISATNAVAPIGRCWISASRRSPHTRGQAMCSVDGCYLGADRAILRAAPENAAHGRGQHPAIRDDPE